MRRLFDCLNARALLVFAISAVLPVLAGSQSSRPLTTQILISKLKWRCVGPYIGGRVVTVTGVPGNDNLFYAGSVGGGVWRSTDDGVEWKNITDGKLPGPSSSIGAIAVAPSDPKMIYVGTGEADIRSDVIPGDGVYKSTDAGQTWQFAGLRDAHSISIILVDPRNADVVYAASMGHVFAPDPDRGIFKSTDGGKTWQKILFVDNKTGAISLVMDPNHPDVMYASMWQAIRTPWSLSSGGPGSGIYKTTDGGMHWSNITRNPGLPQTVLGRVGLSVAASKPETVYAIIQAKDGGVFRSDDSGATWRRVNDEMKLRQRAFYYMTIYADPNDPETVYAPEVDALWVSHNGGKSFTKLRTPHGDNHVVWINPKNTRILLEGNDGGATVSTDGGLTWSTEHNQPTGQFYHVNLDNQFPYHIYGAQQDEGSFEGPSASDGGTIPLSAWQRVAYGESTYSVPQPDDPKITYGSGYFSIFLRQDRRTDQYQSVSPWPFYQEGASSGELKNRFGWTHPILFSPANPKELLVAAQYVFKSDDYGQTWKQISPDLTRNQANTEAPSGGPVDLDQSGAEIYPSISALAVSPLDGNTIWAGSDDGLAHVTTDGGKNWQTITPPGLAEAWISCIEPSHTDKQTAYLTARRYMWDDFRPYVFKTTDLGRHWTAITTGLPQDEFVFDIRQDPNDSQLMFLGTRSTLYFSLDAGSHWQPLTLNLPVAEVRDIAINPREGEVVVATHGRAFWVLDNLTVLEQLTKKPPAQAGAAFLFAPEQAWLTHDYGVPSPDSKRPPDAGYNPPFGATVFFNIPQNYDGKTPVTLAFNDAQGKVIHRFTLHLATEKERREKEKEAGQELPQSQAQASKHEENPAQEVDRSGESTDQQIRDKEAKLTAIEPGMNRFQWDLRYPYAMEVTGYHAPIAAGGLEDSVAGPEIVPGRYSVVLDYGGQQTRQTFVVALDPRLHATQQDLAARMALDLKIHADINALDGDINRALIARDKLENAISTHKLSNAQAGATLAALNRDIDGVAQMKMKGSEGSLLFETRLRDYLAYLESDIDLSYTRPTPAHYAVFNELDQRARTGEQKLESDLAQAGKLVAPASATGGQGSKE